MVRHSLQAPRGPFSNSDNNRAGIAQIAQPCVGGGGGGGSAIDASPLPSRRVGPLPLTPARWAPHCSFRTARYAQIRRLSNFSLNSQLLWIFSFSLLLFLVPRFRFWFLVFGVGSAAAHFKSVQLLRGRVSSQKQDLQLLTSKRFTAQLPPVHPLTHHNDSPKRRYQGHPVLHPWPIR